MREVSQKWIDNQNKTLRDQGLLRLDFLSAHNNNAKANIIPMGSDASKSNINEIKDIAPYGAPNKNLAMPDLTGKEYLGNGVYRLGNVNGVTLDYNIHNGQYVLNGTPTGNVLPFTNTFNIQPMEGTFSLNVISGSSNLSSIFWNGENANRYLLQDIRNGNRVKNDVNITGVMSFITFSDYTRTTYDNFTFKLQLEKGDTATPYEIPQPNTGYVSSIPSGVNGEVATNIAMPDLTGKTEISSGVYRLYNNGITIDYNIYNGEYTINGTISGNPTTFIPLGVSTYVDSQLVFSGVYISGTVSHNERPLFSYSLNNTVEQTFGFWPTRSPLITPSLNGNFVFGIRRISTSVGITYENFTFKLQIEKGTTASAYQLPNYVPIEVNVEDYRSPLNGLTITWSENFGYAVDYSIEYNGEIYTYLNNTKKTVFVPIIVENTPDANFKIRVHKWSEPNSPIRIERVFAGLHLVYKQDKIFSFNKKKINNVLGLELPQDEINFELSNIDRMFDPLWFNSYFKYLNEKTEIRAYSGFRYGENGEEWIKQGTYYLTDWKAPNNSITATFTARDILNLLDADEMYSKDTPLTLDEYCDIILGRDYKGVDDYVPYDLPVNPDGTKKWNIRKNLAVPDLTGKEYLGDGWYRLINGLTFEFKYNIYTGIFIIDGETTSFAYSDIFLQPNFNSGEYYTYSNVKISGTSTDMVRPNIAIQKPNINNFFNETPKTILISTQNIIVINFGDTIFNNFTFKIQIEKGTEATDYELPIENANIPVLKETVNKREALQLIAQSIGCHIKVDDNGNISFIRETYGKQIDVPNKILLTKPEFNLGAPVKKIIVPYSKYNPDPNELEVAKIDVSAGDIVEINHDTPYFNGHGTHTTGSVTLQSTDMTWYRSFKAVIGGTGTGQLIVMREPVIKSSVNVIQDISSSGDTLTYENNLIDTQVKASRAIGRIWGEIDNSREVEFELRIDPRIDTFNVVSFPFRVLNLEQVEYMRVDELELTYNGAYKGKIKGVILSNYGGDLTAKTYTKKADEFASGEENLKWHLLNE